MSTNVSIKVPIFDEKEVRKIIFNNEWYFSVIDICAVLVESSDPGAYWRKLKQRLISEGAEVVTFCHGLKLMSIDGKKYKTDCVNTEGIFRIVQSIPSPKAEPFKLWLAKIGRERIEEMENLLDQQTIDEITRRLVKTYDNPREIYLLEPKGYDCIDNDILIVVDGKDIEHYKLMTAGYKALIGVKIAKRILVYTQAEFDEYSQDQSTLIYPIKKYGQRIYARI